MRFDLTDLRLFLAVAEAGSITHGAAQAGLSLPAASERLRNMEADGQVLLLKRGRRGVQLTEAGEALAHHARLILHQIAQMRGELGEHARALRTSIRIVANTAAITEFLPARLGPWLAANPRMDIDLRERQSVDIARTVSAGFAEIGVLSDAVDTTGLELRPFAIDRLVAILPRSHAMATQKRVAFADLLGDHFIALMGGALQEHIGTQARKTGTEQKIRLRLPGFDAICRMVADGAGTAIVPQTAARRHLRSGTLAMLRLTDRWAVRRLSLCTCAGEEPSHAARALLDHLAGQPA
ncbi:LysR family transcriptional regulator [Xanthobacter sp. TB0136]|uniref:LysR family transcriptional regulator n=1 Tax=Xanthobacter sp. TB0136 TaxID=3459177 RepID=UPI0040392672